MIVVKNDTTQSYLRDWIRVNKLPLWLGLSDKVSNISETTQGHLNELEPFYTIQTKVEGELHWVDDHFTIPFSYWAPGQPKIR